MALCRSIFQGWALRQRRLLITGLALLLMLVALPALAAESAGPATTPETAQVVAGSFRFAQVRILGVPVINVASRSMVGPDAGPDAAERARVIEGNLELLYRPQQPCTPGERIGELLLERSSIGASEAVCDPDHLGLQGAPAALRVVVERQAGGLNELAAVVPGRSTPFPLLTVTAADAQLNGMTAEQLAEHWRGRLERRLRRARGIYASEQIDGRMRIASLVAGLLAGVLVLAVWLWRRLQRQLPRLHRERLTSVGRFAAARFHLVQSLSRLLMASVLLLGVAISAVVLLAWPGQVAPAIDVLFQPLVVMFKALLLVALAALLRAVLGLLLSQWATNVFVPLASQARREQRYRSLLRVLRRLVDLGCLLLFGFWTVMGIPVLRDLSSNALLASGAVLGALALVFQGLLRDFVTGLVLLLDDRYAIGDTVEIGGRLGEVIDVGVLSTELRCRDQRVVVVPNSGCEQSVNHTKLRSGAEVSLLLPSSSDLSQALETIGAELVAFAADPVWRALLLEPPRLLGVEAMTADGLLVGVLLITEAGRQGEARRELLARLVQRLTLTT
ncbi:mechanosensitive ion channel domain-containing protein [Synechococcus sp. RedBA-s]|uniref:mechanosensitive ion channel domain-containing protein n=1 Tax=Synechococcus sp. RedBA-s TaxID=2823741 RepID=UPI0020CBCA4F|nr:mechanosensitive ion channel domain-containing protein [Synechococcus sp. RedBA-s]MCP9801184.1 mechanosensitive ion channel [Synechococcus sp. RedBA-s]